MREIKFRAYHKEAKEMLYEDTLGDVFKWLYEKQPIDIMQFTGLHDKNRKEIYEGDYVKCEEYPNEIGEVYFNTGIALCGAFDIKLVKGEEWMLFSDDPYEIIGNIYENPELLKKDIVDG